MPSNPGLLAKLSEFDFGEQQVESSHTELRPQILARVLALEHKSHRSLRGYEASRRCLTRSPVRCLIPLEQHPPLPSSRRTYKPTTTGSSFVPIVD